MTLIPKNGTSLNLESKHWQDFNIDGNNLFLARFKVPEKTNMEKIILAGTYI